MERNWGNTWRVGEVACSSVFSYTLLKLFRGCSACARSSEKLSGVLVFLRRELPRSGIMVVLVGAMSQHRFASRLESGIA